jgi:hypothetical protein
VGVGYIYITTKIVGLGIGRIIGKFWPEIFFGFLGIGSQVN